MWVDVTVWENTRTETQIWPCLSPAFKPLRAVSAQGAKPKLLLTFKALSDLTSIYLPCQLSSYPYVPATPNPSWHLTLPCAPLLTCLMPLTSIRDASRWPISRGCPTLHLLYEAYLIKSTQRSSPHRPNPHKIVSGPPSELCAFNP